MDTMGSSVASKGGESPDSEIVALESIEAIHIIASEPATASFFAEKKISCFALPLHRREKMCVRSFTLRMGWRMLSLAMFTVVAM